MSVLTFFIITSMTLTGQRLGNITLPGAGGAVETDETDPLIVGLTKEGKILIENQSVSEDEMAQQMQSYLSTNPSGTIIVKADRELVYQEVSQLLQKMAQIGGERVSLAIEKF